VLEERPVPETRAVAILIIGYGNLIRRDDGVGQQAAEAIERWGLPGLKVLRRAQLTPDLAEEMAAAGLVFFLDASSAPSGPAVQIRRMEPPGGESPSLIHTVSPQFLLGLCQALYRQTPECYLVSIPVADLGFGEGLSALAERGLHEALAAIRELLGGPILPEPGPSFECPCVGPQRKPPESTHPGTCP
jgi:hydrogenase maturation protease